MFCPKCKNKKVGVTDTANAPDGRVARVRKCPACGHRFHTMEIIDDGSEDFETEYYYVHKYRTITRGDK